MSSLNNFNISTNFQQNIDYELLHKYELICNLDHLLSEKLQQIKLLRKKQNLQSIKKPNKEKLQSIHEKRKQRLENIQENDDMEEISYF